MVFFGCTADGGTFFRLNLLDLMMCRLERIDGFRLDFLVKEAVVIIDFQQLLEVLGEEWLQLVIIDEHCGGLVRDAAVSEVEHDALVAAADFGRHVQGVLQLVAGTTVIDIINLLIDGFEQFAFFAGIGYKYVDA